MNNPFYKVFFILFDNNVRDKPESGIKISEKFQNFELWPHKTSKSLLWAWMTHFIKLFPSLLIESCISKPNLASEGQNVFKILSYGLKTTLKPYFEHE